jgi:hypothetical protein
MTKGVRTDADLGGKAWLASQGDAQGIHVLLLYDNGLSTKYDTASESLAMPLIGLPIGADIGIIIPALSLVDAGPWKCPAVTGPERPLY